MSARVLYLRRTERGGLLRGVRLVGETTDEVWPSHGEALGGAEDFGKAAAWVKGQLSATRSSSSVAMVCVDAEATAFTWLTSPTSERAVVSVVARFGAGGDGTRGGAGPVDYYAPSDQEASIQALDEMAGAVKGRGAGASPTRRAVMSVADGPARVMIDALDREGVPVEVVAGVWHAMAMVWDPGASGGRANLVDAPTDVGPATGILIQDGNGRLLWCWSRGGRVLAGGSVRLRAGVLEPTVAGEPAGAAGFVCGAEEASRLATEWLAWAAQLGVAPGRIVCVLPEAGEAGTLGGALARLFPGVGIDVATDEDGIGTTLRRAAEILEHTPRGKTPAPSGASALLALSARPGRRHRQMHVWRAMAMGLLACVIALAGWRLQSRAGEAAAASQSWNAKWRELLKTEYPDALKPRPGISPVVALADEVKRRRRELVPPERTEVTMPVLGEIETISMVIGHETVHLESMDVSSARRVSVVLIVPTLREAESVVDSMKRIGGSFVGSWTAKYDDQLSGAQNQAGGQTRKIKVTLQGEWDRSLLKASAGEAKGGGAP